MVEPLTTGERRSGAFCFKLPIYFNTEHSLKSSPKNSTLRNMSNQYIKNNLNLVISKIRYDLTIIFLWSSPIPQRSGQLYLKHELVDCLYQVQRYYFNWVMVIGYHLIPSEIVKLHNRGWGQQ